MEKLVIDKDEIRKSFDKYVEKSLNIFRIQKENGKIIFKNFGALNDELRICTILIGKYFAKELNLIKDDSLNISELAKEIGKPMSSLSGDIDPLLKKGFIEKLPTRRYRIVYHRIDEILDSLVAAINSTKQVKTKK